MKTTVEIPDDLYREARSIAARLGVPFRSLLTDALSAELKRRHTHRSVEEVFGAFAHEPELIHAIDRTVEDDLEDVNPNEWH